MKGCNGSQMVQDCHAMGAQPSTALVLTVDTFTVGCRARTQRRTSFVAVQDCHAMGAGPCAALVLVVDMFTGCCPADMSRSAYTLCCRAGLPCDGGSADYCPGAGSGYLHRVLARSHPKASELCCRAGLPCNFGPAECRPGAGRGYVHRLLPR